MPWLVAYYRPVGLFSLKHGEATSTGGKGLLIPTPFALRTALVDAALRVEGKAVAEDTVALVRALRLALRPPRHAVSNGVLIKVLKPERGDSAKAAQRFFQGTIAFREFVFWQGDLGLAFAGEPAALERVRGWLPHITYLGKRGSFVQLAAPPERRTDLPEGFVPFQPTTSREAFPLGLVQQVDDWGASMTWSRLNVYSSDKIRPGKERVRYEVVLPYVMTQAGRGFTVYRRV